MLNHALLLLILVAYVGFTLAPRLYWLTFGRRCPHCQQGRLRFQGLIDNPWRRLRSWWQCGDCEATLHEKRWGRLETTEARDPALARE